MTTTAASSSLSVLEVWLIVAVRSPSMTQHVMRLGNGALARGKFPGRAAGNTTGAEQYCGLQSSGPMYNTLTTTELQIAPLVLAARMRLFSAPAT